MALTAEQIRCSSVDGYRLPAGVNTESKLREEVNAAKVMIGLITPNSLSSDYVMFELGARWGSGLVLAPLLAGVKASALREPLSLLNGLLASNDAQLHQLLDDIAKYLRLTLQPTPSYIRNVERVKMLADAVARPVTKAAVAAPVKHKLGLSVSAGGTPPSQFFKVFANREVEVSQVEYMLSDETTIAIDDVSRQGESVEIPVNNDLLTQVWNVRRNDRNPNDDSGPAKIRLTVSVDGEPHQYVVPMHMQCVMQGSTMYRKVPGSKTFFRRL